MRCELAILYRPAGGEAVTVAAIADPDLIQAAAVRAIEECERAAEVMADADRMLGELQRFEAQRLRQVLVMLLPHLGTAPGGPAAVM